VVRDFLNRFGIEYTFVPPGDYAALEAAIQPNTRLIFTESPTNPFMYCIDPARLVEIAQRHKIKTVVDATFATPINCQLLTYGIDLVIPHTAYLILRGMKTLSVRMERHNANGLAVAQFLEGHPLVRKVWYPGLKCHPDHAIAQATMDGSGSVVSFELDVPLELCYRFIDSLNIPAIGPSLGGVESIISPLALMGYAHLPEEERLALGIRDELIRFCIGIEDPADLIADLDQALHKIDKGEKQ